MEPRPPAMGVQSVSHWTREVWTPRFPLSFSFRCWQNPDSGSVLVSYNPAGLNHRNALSQSSGDSKSQMQVSSEWVLSESAWEGSALCLSLSFWCLLVILGVPWLVETSLSSSSVFTWFLLCVFFSLCLFSSYNDTSHIGLRVTLLQYGLPW